MLVYNIDGRSSEMNQESKKKRLLLGGYFSSMKDQDEDQDAKRR